MDKLRHLPSHTTNRYRSKIQTQAYNQSQTHKQHTKLPVQFVKNSLKLFIQNEIPQNVGFRGSLFRGGKILL